MGCVDGMIEGRFLIRMKGGGNKRSQCFVPSLMVMAAVEAMVSCLIKSLPLVEAEFPKKCCQVNTQRGDGEPQTRCTIVNSQMQ